MAVVLGQVGSEMFPGEEGGRGQSMGSMQEGDDLGGKCVRQMLSLIFGPVLHPFSPLSYVHSWYESKETHRMPMPW